MYLRRVAITLGIAALLLAITAAGVAPTTTADSTVSHVQPQGTENEMCLGCHGSDGRLAGMYNEFPSGERLYLSVDNDSYQSSVHGQLGFDCVSCHREITGYPHPPVEATNRYEYVLESYELCANCHMRQYEDEMSSVHRVALDTRSTESATCTGCHGTHGIARVDDPVAASVVCERCHSYIYNVFRGSIHGAALIGEENLDVPTCVDCHSVHGVQGPSYGTFHLNSPQICARCHADQDLMEDYDLSTDVFDTYVADFHGTTVILFQSMDPDHETNKAVCTDCHGVHNIQSVDDPDSTVVRENLLTTCRNCHPDATVDFPASWLSHYRPDRDHAPLIYYVNLFYIILIPVVLGGMAFFIATDVFRQLVTRGKRRKKKAQETQAATSAVGGEAKPKKFLRFPTADRIQHWLLTFSFGTLGLTGLIQKYQSFGPSLWMIDTLGGIEVVRILHRAAAFIMMLESIYHLGLVGYRVYVQQVPLSMMPGIKDGIAAVQWILHNLGFRKERPLEGRYTFAEKAEYWALIWGTIVMGVTGFMLWNPITTARFLPGAVIPAAKAAHGAEAVLAVLAILLWHFYHVHIKHVNKSMFDGHLTDEQMHEEHPLELQEMKREEDQEPFDEKDFSQRRRLYLIVYGGLAIVMLVGAFLYIAYEETAITTTAPLLAQDRVPVYAPVPPTPFPTTIPPTPEPEPEQTDEPAPPAPTSWDEGIATLFDERCAACHSSSTSMGDVDLSSYSAAIEAGGDEPIIVSGDPDGSPLIELQASGDHAGQFSDEELEAIRQWITDGAPESADDETAAGEETAAAAVDWNSQIGALFEDRCTACHSSATSMGDVDLSSYSAAMEAGGEEPIIVPGDAEGSPLIELQAGGGHAGQFSDEELDAIRQWISEGALEAAAEETTAPAAGWDSQIGALFEARCAACHGSSTSMGDIDLGSYSAAMEAGGDELIIVSGDSASSPLVVLQQEGGHAGQFSDEELESVVQWIDEGTPE